MEKSPRLNRPTAIVAVPVAAMILLIVLIVGVLIGRQGAAWPGGDDAATAAVLREARQTLTLHKFDLYGPLAPLVLRFEVESVTRDPGHCQQRPQGTFADTELFDYRLEVTGRSLFSLPFRRYALHCGGTAFTRL